MKCFGFLFTILISLTSINLIDCSHGNQAYAAVRFSNRTIQFPIQVVGSQPLQAFLQIQNIDLRPIQIRIDDFGCAPQIEIQKINCHGTILKVQENCSIKAISHTRTPGSKRCEVRVSDDQGSSDFATILTTVQ